MTGIFFAPSETFLRFSLKTYIFSLKMYILSLKRKKFSYVATNISPICQKERHEMQKATSQGLHPGHMQKNAATQQAHIQAFSYICAVIRKRIPANRLENTTVNAEHSPEAPLHEP